MSNLVSYSGINCKIHQIIQKNFKNLTIILDAGASSPLLLPMGLMYGDDAASFLQSVPIDTHYTLILWAYLYRIDQEAYVFSMV